MSIAYETDPPLAAVLAAVGGGPLLLRDGAPVDDPGSPNYADRGRRIPVAAAARFPDGTLALVVVDGRHPATSIGVNRAELSALLAALGATDAMLFDSGGSATLAARVLGDDAAIGSGAALRDTIVFPGTEVGPRTILIGAIAGHFGIAASLRPRQR